MEQLLLWLPHDERLLWQFGELLNAQGEVKLAWDRFKLLTPSGRGTPLFWEHRRKLLETIEADPRYSQPETATADLPKVSASPTEAPGPRPWLPDWRQLGVGFGSGLLVGMLLLLQLRQFRRRVSGSPAPSSR